jgi:dolichol-phosphate mannosyltransferase
VLLGSAGFVVLAYLSGLKLVTGAEIGGRPLLLLGVMLAIIGVQVTLFGVLGELILSRTQPAPPTSLVRERRG